MKRNRTKSSDSFIHRPKAKGRKGSVASLNTNASDTPDSPSSPTEERKLSIITNGLTLKRSNTKSSIVASPISEIPDINSHEENLDNTIAKLNLDEVAKDAKFTLRLISYGRANGALPKPKEGEEMLRFSVKDMPNPPAKLRQNYDGTHARIRKEVFLEKKCRERYDLMVSEIEKIMIPMETAVSYDDKNPGEREFDEKVRVLVVGVSCQEGMHRSVAFVEELASGLGKRKDWGVVVIHRDLGIMVNGDQDGIEEEDEENEGEEDLEPPPTPISALSVKEARKRDKKFRNKRDKRLAIEVGGGEDGFI